MNTSVSITLQQFIACFAVHALWQIPLLAGAAWCAISLGRPLPAFQRENRLKRFLHRHYNRRDGLQPLLLTLPTPWARCITMSYLVLTLFFALRLAVSWWHMRLIVHNASQD